MADIAFLLLIFFLVTTVFDEEKGLPLVLPTADVVDVPPRNVMQFLVGRDGVVEVQRRESVHSQFLRPDEVERIWRWEAARNSHLVALVRTDADAPYGSMIQVLDALQGAGAKRISLQVRERRPGAALPARRGARVATWTVTPWTAIGYATPDVP